MQEAICFDSMVSGLFLLILLGNLLLIFNSDSLQLCSVLSIVYHVYYSIHNVIEQYLFDTRYPKGLIRLRQTKLIAYSKALWNCTIVCIGYFLYMWFNVFYSDILLYSFNKWNIIHFLKIDKSKICESNVKLNSF